MLEIYNGTEEEQGIIEQLQTYVENKFDLTSKLHDDLQTAVEQEITLLLEKIPQTQLRFPKAMYQTVLLREILGLGIIDALLESETITEIMVNADKAIYVEERGKIKKLPQTIRSLQKIDKIIERIVIPLGRRIDEASPMVDARLEDGSRVNIIIAPLSVIGPIITIRKFPQSRLTMGNLLDLQALSEEMAAFLERAVGERQNIVVSGGTGSGKTTLLNVLSSYINKHERIISIEDSAELRLDQEHVITLEARQDNVEGKGAVSILDLLKNTLRMRPNRIIVGECRGSEALAMLQAMNTGHEGSLTTIHANTERDALRRMETMILMANIDLPLTAIREQIASAIDIVIQSKRLSCGRRVVSSISEVCGREGNMITLHKLYSFSEGADHEFRSSGMQARFMADNAAGNDMPLGAIS